MNDTDDHCIPNKRDKLSAILGTGWTAAANGNENLDHIALGDTGDKAVISTVVSK